MYLPYGVNDDGQLVSIESIDRGKMSLIQNQQVVRTFLANTTNPMFSDGMAFGARKGVGTISMPFETKT